MALWSHRPRSPAALHCLTALLWLLTAEPLLAQTPATGEPEQPRTTAAADMEKRVRQLEQRQAELVEQNRQLSSQVRDLSVQKRRPLSTGLLPDAVNQLLSDSIDEPTDGSGLFTLPDALGRGAANMFPESTVDNPDDEEEILVGRGSSAKDAKVAMPGYFAGYDKGFVIRPTDPEKRPFELKVNSQDQVRYTGFARSVRTWTDSAGIVRTVTDMSSFQIPRGRLIFSGFVFRQNLTYNLNIDYNTVSNSQINFRAYWLAWRFNQALTVYIGQSKVPGSREWLASIMRTQGLDRAMATTFFRPSLSQGIWATGEPIDGLFYHAMMSNGVNTLGVTPQQLNLYLALSGSVWWEPLGDFGGGYSDFEWHEKPAIRLGTSLTYSPERGPQGSPDAPENSDLRLSNGTLLTEPGALAPGVTLTSYKIGLATFDFAFKYRGISLSSEYYLQDLFDLGGNGPLPRSSIFQHGGFVQAGFFAIPKKFEMYGRTSYVTGPFGTGSEYAGGFNWFCLPDKQNLRFTFEADYLNHCPADQNRTNFQAGQTGWLLRSQVQIFF